MLREVLWTSITPFLPQLHTPLPWDIPIQSWRVVCVCPRQHRAASSPLLQVAGFVQQSSCHPAVVLSPVRAGPSEGQAVKQAPFKLKQQPSLHLWLGQHFPGFITSTEWVSSSCFLTEHFLRPDRQTFLSLPLSGAVFYLFTCRKHGYNTFLCQQGNLHSHTGRSTELAETFF